jgi:hypothetical protein
MIGVSPSGETKGDKMTNQQFRLTRRGIIVRNILIAIIAFLAYAWLNDITTPEHCKVPVEQMTPGCIAILYP